MESVSLVGVQVTNMSMSQQCILTGKETNYILGYIRKSGTIILKELILFFLFKKSGDKLESAAAG